ncbi:MAG: isoprenylcysteine carboxylmethyltransferase family protein [Acidobacteriota bacterium]
MTKDLQALISFVVWGAYFAELIVAGMTFRRVGPSLYTLPLGITFAIMASQTGRAQLIPLLAIPGLAILAGALILLGWSARTVRGRLFSYIGNNDTPQFVCQEGPYAFIRHPFYTAYLLTHLAVTVMFPNLVTLGVLFFTFGLLWHVAGFEERKFERSPVSVEYRAYGARTGRFIPRKFRK